MAKKHVFWKKKARKLSRGRFVEKALKRARMTKVTVWNNFITPLYAPGVHRQARYKKAMAAKRRLSKAAGVHGMYRGHSRMLDQIIGWAKFGIVHEISNQLNMLNGTQVARAPDAIILHHRRCHATALEDFASLALLALVVEYARK